MTTSKIKIKLGAIEIEYEGSETFLKEELPQLLSAVSELYAKSRKSFDSEPEYKSMNSGNSEPSVLLSLPQSDTKLELTTGTIAGKLKVNSASDLLMAAAAQLRFVQNLHVFTRENLITEIKSATAYYKPGHLKNLSQTLNTLVKGGKLNEQSKNKFALTASSLKDLEPRIV
jgi:hypothetical protein